MFQPSAPSEPELSSRAALMLERVEKSGTLLIQGNESLEFYFHFVSHYFTNVNKEL